MAFFEQLGKKITDAGQGVAQQTKNMADIARLNSAISDKKKQIASFYSSLGEAYYNLHKDDAENDLRETVDKVTQLFAEIDQSQEEIKQIKGVTKCPNCGADVPLNSAFCSSCGTPAQPAAAPTPAPALPDDMVECPNCHKPVKKGNKFCTSCGTKMPD